MKPSAIASGTTPWMRSSVDRSTREISDVTMMVTMNQRRDLDAFRPLEDVGDASCRRTPA